MSNGPQGPSAFARDAHAKALSINLDPSIYGSFAEIGAGQEVARLFLSAGGAAGTIAQTISAYDKVFSDATYGEGTRYVSRERLLAMLDHEYRLLLERLGPSRGAQSRFFVFADTVSARNYKGDNEQHGWVGLRFQSEPGSEPNHVLLHVNLMDPTALLQQQALGLLGVNLLYAAYHQRSSAEDFLRGLWSELSTDRLEVDVLELKGPAFADADVRLWCMDLLRLELAHALVFDTESRVVEPSSILRKRPLIVDRGRFETVEPFHRPMLRASERHLRGEGIPLERDPTLLVEISTRPVDGECPECSEVLARVDRVRSNVPVLVTDFAELYPLAAYLRRHTAEPVRFVMGVSLLARVMEDRFYDELPGSLLEGLGRVFAQNVKVYAYPMPREALMHALEPHSTRCRIADSAGELITADDLILEPPANHLYRYLREGRWVLPVEPA